VVKEELWEGEVTLYQRDENPITTLTWFRGDAEKAAQILKERLEKILDLNRWLGGRVVQQKPAGRVYLTFDKSKKLNPRDFLTTIVPQESPLQRRTPLQRLAKECKDLLLRNGPTEPLFQVTLVPCCRNPKTHFALIVALSHVVADGYTYYKLLSMLCSDNDNNDCIAPLIYERIATTAQQQAAAMGQVNYDFFAKPGLAFFVNYAWGAVRARTVGPATQCVFALVDEERMQEEKAKGVLVNNKYYYNQSSSVDFVSTNDVLTSWFLQHTQADVGAMAINFRNRLHGHTDQHAGNYESIIIFGRPDSASPTLIRKSLENFRRTETINDPVPNFLESLGLTNALVTNWSSFANPNVIRGCQEELHIPLYDAGRLVPTDTTVMIIFRAGPKGLGLFMAGTPEVLRRLGYSRQFTKRAPFLSTEPLF